MGHMVRKIFVFPAVMAIDGRARAVGNGIAERDNCSGGRRRRNIDRLQPERGSGRGGKRCGGFIGRNIARAIRGQVGRHWCAAVLAWPHVGAGNVKADRKVLLSENNHRYRVARDTAAGRNSHGCGLVEEHLPI